MATLQIAIQPPAVAQQGYILYPPLAVTMSTASVANGTGGSPASVWASASLVTENGAGASHLLSGSVVESVHAFAGGDESTGYILFNNLSIDGIGNFRIQVSVMCMGNNAAICLGTVESDVVNIVNYAVRSPALNASEHRFLQALPN